MKSLVVYYTRSGRNTVIAETIARDLDAEVRRIETPRRPSFLVAGACSSMNLPMRIKPMDTDVSAFDLIVLCAPVWAGKPASPARAFLQQANLDGKRLAVSFSTAGGPTQRAQGKLKAIVSGRDVSIVSFGEIDTNKATDEHLRSEASAFAGRLRE